MRAAPLHDVGKVGVPDAILLKPDRLTPAEFAIMQEHCELGAEVLSNADEKLQFQSFLKIAILLARHHHEKWNGSGYPSNLEGESIPVSGRIMALSDVYDALRSQRSYKSGFSHAKSVEIITEGRGSHFDPEIVDVFLRSQKEFLSVSTVMADFAPQKEIAELEALG